MPYLKREMELTRIISPLIRYLLGKNKEKNLRVLFLLYVVVKEVQQVEVGHVVRKSAETENSVEVAYFTHVAHELLVVLLKFRFLLFIG